MGKLRERLQELRSQRETEQHKHSVAVTELRVKLHEEKQREVVATRESLSRQHETELARAARLRETETGPASSTGVYFTGRSQQRAT